MHSNFSTKLCGLSLRYVISSRGDTDQSHEDVQHQALRERSGKSHSAALSAPSLSATRRVRPEESHGPVGQVSSASLMWAARHARRRSEPTDEAGGCRAQASCARTTHAIKVGLLPLMIEGHSELCPLHRASAYTGTLSSSRHSRATSGIFALA